MTIYDLHLELKKRVKALTEATGIHDLKVYIRNLPPIKYEGDADKLFPHCLVSVGDGSDDGEESKITVFLGLGTKDTAPELTGYQDICHLIEILRLSFAENPMIGKYAEIKGTVNYTLTEQEENTYPYFFGAVWFDVLIPSPQRGYNDLV